MVIIPVNRTLNHKLICMRFLCKGIVLEKLVSNVQKIIHDNFLGIPKTEALTFPVAFEY